MTKNLGNFIKNLGYGAVRFDYAGSGDSEGEFAEDTSVIGWRQDLESIVTWVHGQEIFKSSPILLYGHSLGGLIVLTHPATDKRIIGRVLFTPEKYQSMTLVDGAVKNNLPTDILRHMGADVVIGVDLGYDGQANYDIKTVGEILMQCIEIMSREVTLLKSEQHADVIIRPNTYDSNFKDIKQALLCIGRGEEAVVEKLAIIKELFYMK